MLTQAAESGDMIDPSWPAEVGIILSALDAGAWLEDRRDLRRWNYHVKAVLRLFTDLADSDEKTLYTRDVNSRSLGFLTPHRLPLGYGGHVHVPAPTSARTILDIPCTVLRCREAAPGWFEGAIGFVRERMEFAEANPAS